MKFHRLLLLLVPALSANVLMSAAMAQQVTDQRYMPWMNPAMFDSIPYPKDVPQSLRTFTEGAAFSNAQAHRLPVTYVTYGTEERQENGSIINPSSRQRARERGWDMQMLISDRNAQRSHPNELVELILATLVD